MAEEPPRGSAEERAYRRGFRQKDRRDDYALDLFRDARENLANVGRVDRILLELGRFYNPLVDGPIVDLPTRQRIVELLRASRADEAMALLDERYKLYAPIGDDAGPDRSGPTPS